MKKNALFIAACSSVAICLGAVMPAQAQTTQPQTTQPSQIHPAQVPQDQVTGAAVPRNNIQGTTDQSTTTRPVTGQVSPTQPSQVPMDGVTRSGVPTTQAQPAHPSQPSSEFVAAMRAEPPLTQQDIDTYIRVWPTLGPNQHDKTRAAQILRDAGWTENRAAYVTNKIMVTQPYAVGAPQNDIAAIHIPDYFKPTTDEITLVRRNLDRITRMQDQLFGERG